MNYIKTFMLLASLLFIPFTSFGTNSPIALLLNISGAIGPATQDFVVRGIHQAEKSNAELIILQMDTPGGLDTSMRGIIKAILASPVPVVTYVAPAGARAASAGTFILYASHVAAMAPGTNLGSAAPVQIGGGGDDFIGGNKNNNRSPQKTTMENTMKAKVINDAVAYIKGLADLRGRNAEWAEAAVRQAESLTAKEALAKNVINLVAENIPQLLVQLNGYKISMDSKTKILNTQGITIQPITPDWRTKLLAVITDPSVAYILLLIGIYGLFFEFASPGYVLPGVIGAIALLLALYAFQLLPINYAGLALIILGLAFLAAEAFMPSFGILGIGGIVAFVAGSILLLDTDLQGFSINWYLILLMALLNAAFFIGIIGMVIRARRRPAASGREELLHMEGEALQDFTTEGWIRIHSERWKATTTTPIKKGQKVIVESIDGLILKVKPKKNA